MKILHLITSLDIGGAELVLYRLLLAQRDNRQNITVVSLKADGVLAEQLRQSGFSVYSLNVANAVSLVAAVPAFVRLLKQLQPDVVQSWLYHADFIAALSSFRWPAARYIWGIHTCQLPKGKLLTKLIMKACARLSYKVPAKIVCVAEASRLLHKEQGYQENKLIVIPNGFELNAYQVPVQMRAALRQELRISGTAIVVGVVARWHADKGQDVMLEAIRNIQAGYPDVVFLFIGRGCDASNEALQTLIKQCPVPNQILTLGERSDIPQLLGMMDIFCMPSRTEAFPLALGEAMCAGLPVVTTAVGDVEYMTGKLLQLVEPGNSDKLAEGLKQMLDMSAEHRAELGDALQRRVTELFSIQTMASRYQQLYQDVLP